MPLTWRGFVLCHCNNLATSEHRLLITLVLAELLYLALDLVGLANLEVLASGLPDDRISLSIRELVDVLDLTVEGEVGLKGVLADQLDLGVNDLTDLSNVSGFGLGCSRILSRASQTDMLIPLWTYSSIIIFIVIARFLSPGLVSLELPLDESQLVPGIAVRDGLSGGDPWRSPERRSGSQLSDRYISDTVGKLWYYKLYKFVVKPAEGFAGPPRVLIWCAVLFEYIGLLGRKLFVLA